MSDVARALPQDEALVQARRRQIFQAACRVLARKSFHEASVKELALEAGLAAGSIYVYLQSKDDIIPLIAESMVSEFIEQLPQIRADAAGDPRRELVLAMSTILDVIDQHREAFTVLHHEARYLERRPQFRAAMKKAVQGYVESIVEIVERGASAGLIHCEDSRAAAHAVHMLCAGWAMGANNLKHISKETYRREITGMVEGRFFTHPTNGNGAASR